MVAQDLLQRGPGDSLGLAAGAAPDVLAGRRVADGRLGIEAAIGRRWNPDPAALRAYRIHIGLGSIGYRATHDRWDDVAFNAQWLLALA